MTKHNRFELRRKHGARTGAFILATCAILGLITVGHGVFFGKAKGAYSQFERRKLTTLRDVAKAPFEKKGVTFNDFVGDQLAARASIIHVLNAIKVYGFSSSTNKDIVFGPEGSWIRAFATGDENLFKAPCKHVVSQYDWAAKINQMKTIQERMDRAGAPSIFLVVPNKTTLRPDWMPEVYGKFCDIQDQSVLLGFRDKAKAEGIRIVFPVEEIRSAGIAEFYDVRERHWSRAGVEKFVKIAEAQYPGFFPAPYHNKTKVRRRRVDLSRALGLQRVFYNERSLDYPLRKKLFEKKTKAMVKSFKARRHQVRCNSVTKGEDRPRVLLVGDSFTGMAETALFSRYKSLCRVTNMYFKRDYLEKSIEAYKPDATVIVFEDAKLTKGWKELDAAVAPQ